MFSCASKLGLIKFCVRIIFSQTSCHHKTICIQTNKIVFAQNRRYIIFIQDSH
ncbi:MAG: (4Fe-4S)-binding protein [Candidatus Omnitrophica bacterium]|nr:(4Fe-4S)-binding protein [Candidatus Omnitrophota bacterium]